MCSVWQRIVIPFQVLPLADVGARLKASAVPLERYDIVTTDLSRVSWSFPARSRETVDTELDSSTMLLSALRSTRKPWPLDWEVPVSQPAPSSVIRFRPGRGTKPLLNLITKCNKTKVIKTPIMPYALTEINLFRATISSLCYPRRNTITEQKRKTVIDSRVTE